MKTGVKIIQAADYNGVCTVDYIEIIKLMNGILDPYVPVSTRDSTVIQFLQFLPSLSLLNICLSLKIDSRFLCESSSRKPHEKHTSVDQGFRAGKVIDLAWGYFFAKKQNSITIRQTYF